MRPRIALFDAALGDGIESFASLFAAGWTCMVVSPDNCDTLQSLPVIVPATKGQSCCGSRYCIRDAVVSRLPDRAVVVAIILRPELQCLAECADTIFACDTVARWCHQRSIPARGVKTIAGLRECVETYLQKGIFSTRHRAQLYRQHLAEVE
jgi:hypothetical protein